VGGSYESGLHSPVNLNASTFADELKIATAEGQKYMRLALKNILRFFQRGMQLTEYSGMITHQEPGCHPLIIWRLFLRGLMISMQ